MGHLGPCPTESGRVLDIWVIREHGHDQEWRSVPFDEAVKRGGTKPADGKTICISDSCTFIPSPGWEVSYPQTCALWEGTGERY